MLVDKFYSALQKSKPERLTLAGWFDDGLTESQRQDNRKIDLFTTPTYKLKVPQTERPLVLLSTGGFGPLHSGHLQIMEIARQTLLTQGLEVCGGYLSPSHDHYILTKYPEAHNASDRLTAIDKILFTHPFLMTDPWESLYSPTSLNFTEVIERLQLYLRRWFHPNTEVVYVFGSDNQGFLEAFTEQGLGVCVKRKTELEESLKYCIDNKRLWFVSSTGLDQFSSRALPRIKKEVLNSNLYLVRDDLSLSLNQNSSSFFKILKNNFPEFDFKILPGMHDVDLSNTLSLDPWVRGENNLDITRQFNLSGGQIHGQKLIARLESNLSLDQQWSRIPKGNYRILDDDISSGQTVNFIKNHLPPRCTVSKTESLVDIYFKGQTPEFVDIVDARDFFWGAKYGGLTVMLPNGELSRVPYLLPWVQLNFRAKFDLNQALRFSKDILKLNIELHPTTKIKDLPPSQQPFFYWQGYEPEDYLKDFLLKALL